MARLQDVLVLGVSMVLAGASARSHHEDAAHTRGLLKKLGRGSAPPIPPPGEGYFNQTLDHILDVGTHANANVSYWPQRFQFNETHHTAGGPVFLVLGGEGPANALWLSANTAVMTYAAKLGAAVYQLEHRFYGKSQPFGDLSTEHLSFLSSRQALADANNFAVQHLKSKFGASTKVISFGGSYSGALSAWLRLKYPDTIYAAISTSSPILVCGGGDGGGVA